MKKGTLFRVPFFLAPLASFMLHALVKKKRGKRGKIPLDREYVPPNNLMAERFVLGACLLDIKVTLEALSLLDPEDFYDMRHQQVFRIIREMIRNGIPVDMITVLEYIAKKYPRENEGNLSSLLASYIDQVSTTATASYQISAIIDCSLKRKIMVLAGNMMKIGMDPGKSGEESLSEVEQQIFALTINRKGENLIHLREALSGAMEEIQENIRDQGVPKATTGFRAVDSVIGGLTPGSVYVLAARPSMGENGIIFGYCPKPGRRNDGECPFFQPRND